MDTIIVEHHFEDRSFDIDRYNDAQRGNAWCLETHGVRHVVSYVTPEARRMICVFEAPDAEAVRRTARELGYKYDRLWPATIVR